MNRDPESSNALDVGVLTDALAHDPMFEASDRLKALLAYLGDHAAKGDRVTQTEIAKDIMALGSGFDPQVDAHVRIEVGRLRKALELHYARQSPSSPHRIMIPKGSYRPEISTKIPVTSEVAPPLAKRIILFTCIVCDGDLSEDVAELAARELRVHCFASPLSRSGVMRFPVGAASSSKNAEKMSLDAQADLALSVNGYRSEKEFRILIDVSIPKTSEVVYSQRLVFASDLEPNQLAQKIARGTANVLCDPILGVVPTLVAKLFDHSDLQVILSAYQFMATQKTEMIPGILAGLEHISNLSTTAAPVKALRAEITRVNSWLTGSNAKSDAFRCLEMAEDAVAEDPTDLTCRIALAYNRLNAGLIEAALHTGANTLSTPAPTSLTHMSRLLVAISDTEGQHRTLLSNSDLDDDTTFFMKEFAQVIPLIRWSEVQEAERRLSSSLFPNIFWLHVFHAAILAEMGDAKRAAQCADRIRQRLPNCQITLKRMIKGVFPRENEYSYLIRGLNYSGLRLN